MLLPESDGDGGPAASQSISSTQKLKTTSVVLHPSTWGWILAWQSLHCSSTHIGLSSGSRLRTDKVCAKLSDF